jgi:dehydrogenase/reductase SDR family protein 1
VTTDAGGHARLDGAVAVVTGASRGIGRGIAIALGEAGATVYVTGRTVNAGDAPRPGTVGETADAVDAAGGHGIAVACDHRDDAQVAALFQQVSADHGRLDLLVNNAFSIPSVERVGSLMAPFWELDTEVWDHMHSVGFRSHYVASVHAARMMVPRRSGLIVHVSSFGAVRYHFNVPYHAAKAGVDKMTRDMAYELRPHDVGVVSLWPDLVLTDTILEHGDAYERRKGDTPLFVGRLVAALAADPATIHKSGMSLGTFELGRDFGIPDPLTDEMLLRH